MSEFAREVIIDGVRYLPAVEVKEPTLDVLRDALLALWWTPELLAMPKYADAAQTTYIVISDTTEGYESAPTIADFLDGLKLSLSARP